MMCACALVHLHDVLASVCRCFVRIQAPKVVFMYDRYDENISHNARW